MSIRILRFGVLTGLVGGMTMAMFSMVVFAVIGRGFFAPLDLIAHTFWRGSPLDGSFSVTATIIGMMIHLGVSLMLGTVMALLIEHSAFDGGMIAVVAVLLGLGAWVAQAFLWPLVDKTASSAFDPWVFAIAHACFSAGAAIALLKLEHARVQRDAPSDQVVDASRPSVGRIGG